MQPLRFFAPAIFILAVLSPVVAEEARPEFPMPPAAEERAEGRQPPQAEKPAASPSESEAQAEAVDVLLDKLAQTREPEQAKRIATALQALWRRSGSDTIDLLVNRSTEAQRASKISVAVKIMDEVVSIRPQYAEGWNRRATLHFLARDYAQAMGDIHETLVREPRHYGAWVGLGRILKESDLDAKALAAFRRALEIYPAIDGLKREVDELALKVEGQPI